MSTGMHHLEVTPAEARLLAFDLKEEADHLEELASWRDTTAAERKLFNAGVAERRLLIAKIVLACPGA
jgi:hypothetical protein